MRPELTGIGAAPQSRAKAASERSRYVFASGNEQVPGGVDADAGQRDQLGCGGGDQGGQVDVEVVDLGLPGQPPASGAA